MNKIRNTVYKKWSLEIINAIDAETQLRYKDLSFIFEDASPTQLSTVPKELEREEIIKNETFNEIPPKIDPLYCKEEKNS